MDRPFRQIERNYSGSYQTPEAARRAYTELCERLGTVADPNTNLVGSLADVSSYVFPRNGPKCRVDAQLSAPEVTLTVTYLTPPSTFQPLEEIAAELHLHRVTGELRTTTIAHGGAQHGSQSQPLRR